MIVNINNKATNIDITKREEVVKAIKKLKVHTEQLEKNIAVLTQKMHDCPSDAVIYSGMIKSEQQDLQSDNNLIDILQEFVNILDQEEPGNE